MKMTKLVCPNCGATLELKENLAFCYHCGSKLLIDDENKTTTHNYNYNYSYVNRDEARIRENERIQTVRLKELEHEEKKEKRDFIYPFVGLGLVVLMLLVGLFFIPGEEEPEDDEIKMPVSASDYVGEQYESVIQELEDLGFENIKTAKKEDLVTGWITEDGEVYRVSIDGDSEFEEGDIFPEDAKVVVTYHTFEE